MIVSSACFSALLDEGDILIDALGGGRRRLDRDRRRIGEELVGQLADRLGHGGGEEQRLALLRQQPHDLASSAWMKPRSSIWSASSSTRISSIERLTYFCSIRSIKRPGVATRISIAARHILPVLADAGAAEHGCDATFARICRSRARFRRSGWRVRASARGRACGNDTGSGRLPLAWRDNWSEGSTKAAVLPVPVCAMPSRSRPSSRVGIDCAWIGVGLYHSPWPRSRGRVVRRGRVW